MSPVEQTAAVRVAIEAANARAMDAFRRRDAASLAEVYAVEGVALPPHAAAVRGRPALEQMWQQGFETGLTGCRLDTVAVECAGDLAVEEGHYTLYTGDHQIADEGKYIQIWKQEDGQWRSHRDIWNSDRPV